MAMSVNPKSLMMLAAVLFSLGLVLFPLDAFADSFSYSLAVVVITLVGWSSGWMPPFMTALIFFALATIFDLLDPNLLFSGFGSTAVWLIISGFIIGAAISNSGLGKTLASFIAPYITGSYLSLIAGLVFTAMLLGFIMPSSVGRAVVLIPIGMALAEQVGFSRGSNGSLGVATSLTLACNMPSFAILPANIPNMILSGSSETLFNLSFGYTEYLLLHFPILGLVKSIVIVFLTTWLFPAKIDSRSVNDIKLAAFTIDDAKQKKVIFILAITLLLWVTDTWHGVNAAWVGLLTSIALLLPKWGVVETKSFSSHVDFGTLVFVASALGLGTLVNHSGIGAQMGQLFSDMIPGTSAGEFANFMALSVISTITGLVATVPGVPTVLTPMAAELAQSSGFSVPEVLMTQVIGFSTVIFPFQVAPLIIAMQLSKEPLPKLLKLTFPLTLITLTILVPLDFLWWSLLGWA